MTELATQKHSCSVAILDSGENRIFLKNFFLNFLKFSLFSTKGVSQTTKHSLQRLYQGSKDPHMLRSAW